MSDHAEQEPARAMQQRHLLPRWPPDWAVAGLLAAGIVAFVVTGAQDDAGLWWLAPGAAAAVWQKVAGHVSAWRSDGVERAFVVESAALCFYVVVAGCALAGVLQLFGIIEHLDPPWVVVGALFADTMVRDQRRNRYA